VIAAYGFIMLFFIQRKKIEKEPKKEDVVNEKESDVESA